MTKKSSAKIPLCQSPAAPVPRRVQDRLSRITLEKNAAQLTGFWREKSAKLLAKNGSLHFRKAMMHFGLGLGPGHIAWPSHAGAKPTDAPMDKTPRDDEDLQRVILTVTE